MFGCRHKWLPVDMFGYQHCAKCGICESVGIPCNHKWEVYEQTGVYKGRMVVGKLYVLKCKLCGDLKNHASGLMDKDFLC